jgi:hypothetical protein
VADEGTPKGKAARAREAAKTGDAPRTADPSRSPVPDPPRPGEIARRYSGDELVIAVLQAAEQETEERHEKAWAGAPARINRPAGGWQAWARDMTGTSVAWREHRAWTERYAPRRQALADAVREARADADVWRALTEECPALAHVSLDNIPTRYNAPSRATIARLLDGFFSSPVGPTWRGREPTDRDLALLLILSGWTCNEWVAGMTVAEAIKEVVKNVRTVRRAMHERERAARAVH